MFAVNQGKKQLKRFEADAKGVEVANTKPANEDAKTALAAKLKKLKKK